MNKELIFILGGARSGKSSHAQKLARERGGASVLFVATAEPMDDEMRQRIALHRAERPIEWRTLEAPRDVGAQIRTAAGDIKVVLLDCLTLLVSNVLLALDQEVDAQVADTAVQNEVESLLDAYRAGSATWIVVSNEVGLGSVPLYPLGRVFRDVMGRTHQRLAAEADRVLFMVAGLPMQVK